MCYLRSWKKDRLDYQGRNILFSKGKQKKIPTSREIIDKLIFIIAMYGFDTFVLSKAQGRFKDYHKELFAKPWTNKHEHPCVFSEDIKPPETKKKDKFDDDCLSAHTTLVEQYIPKIKMKRNVVPIIQEDMSLDRSCKLVI